MKYALIIILLAGMAGCATNKTPKWEPITHAEVLDLVGTFILKGEYDLPAGQYQGHFSTNISVPTIRGPYLITPWGHEVEILRDLPNGLGPGDSPRWEVHCPTLNPGGVFWPLKTQVIIGGPKRAK